MTVVQGKKKIPFLQIFYVNLLTFYQISLIVLKGYFTFLLSYLLPSLKFATASSVYGGILVRVGTK